MKKNYSKLFYALLGIALPFMAGAQCTYPTNISTIAGSHVNGYTGNGSPALEAQIGSPYSVTSDASGNLYIADYFNNAVRKVQHSTGIITTIAGTGTAGYNGDGIAATAAQLNGPAGITFDGVGNLYIADKFNERIRKVATDGTITTIAGNGLHGGLGTVPFGNEGPATDAALTYPIALAFDCSGNLYVADNGSQTVRKIYADGIIREFAGTHAGGYNGDGIQATAAQLNYPSSLAADCAGNVYISDSWNNRIRKVDASGIITTVAGNGDSTYTGDGGAATSASLWIPWGIALGCDNLFICDYNNNAVRVVNSAGTISTFAGSNTRGYDGDGGAATAASIYLPGSLAIDAYNNIFIADYGNYVVRYMGTVPYASRAYVNGTTQDLKVNANTATDVSAMMAVPVATAGATVTWSVSRNATHGTLSGFSATAIATGSVVLPTGLVYTPQPGYVGTDEFTILMDDGHSKASSTLNVKVDSGFVGVTPVTAAVKGSAYPNPNNGSFKCEFVSEASRDLQLVAKDITGRTIYTQTVHAVAGTNTVSINLPASVQRPAMVIVSLSNGEVTYPNIKMMVTE